MSSININFYKRNVTPSMMGNVNGVMYARHNAYFIRDNANKSEPYQSSCSNCIECAKNEDCFYCCNNIIINETSNDAENKEQLPFVVNTYDKMLMSPFKISLSYNRSNVNNREYICADTFHKNNTIMTIKGIDSEECKYQVSFMKSNKQKSFEEFQNDRNNRMLCRCNTCNYTTEQYFNSDNDDVNVVNYRSMEQREIESNSVMREKVEEPLCTPTKSMLYDTYESLLNRERYSSQLHHRQQSIFRHNTYQVYSCQEIRTKGSPITVHAMIMKGQEAPCSSQPILSSPLPCCEEQQKDNSANMSPYSYNHLNFCDKNNISCIVQSPSNDFENSCDSEKDNNNRDRFIIDDHSVTKFTAEQLTLTIQKEEHATDMKAATAAEVVIDTSLGTSKCNDICCSYNICPSSEENTQGITIKNSGFSIDTNLEDMCTPRNQRSYSRSFIINVEGNKSTRTSLDRCGLTCTNPLTLSSYENENNNSNSESDNVNDRFNTSFYDTQEQSISNKNHICGNNCNNNNDNCNEYVQHYANSQNIVGAIDESFLQACTPRGYVQESDPLNYIDSSLQSILQRNDDFNINVTETEELEPRLTNQAFCHCYYSDNNTINHISDNFTITTIHTDDITNYQYETVLLEKTNNCNINKEILFEEELVKIRFDSSNAFDECDNSYENYNNNNKNNDYHTYDNLQCDEKESEIALFSLYNRDNKEEKPTERCQRNLYSSISSTSTRNIIRERKEYRNE